jgi:hypothetical protein
VDRKYESQFEKVFNAKATQEDVFAEVSPLVEVKLFEKLKAKRLG